MALTKIRIPSQGTIDANLPMNTFKITGLGTPTDATDATTKAYVDGLVQGIKAKASVRVASIGTNLTLSGAQVIDGVQTSANDRILVKDQTLKKNNGIYLVATGSWTRALDFDVWDETISALVFIEEGTINADTSWLCTNNLGGTFDTTDIVFVQFSHAGTITAANVGSNTGKIFRDKVGNVLNFKSIGTVTTGMGLTLATTNGADDITLTLAGTLTASHGGTGVANADTSTITLGGALTFSGAYATTFTVTNTTTVTLPTTGTLATLANHGESFTNKDGYNGLVVTENSGVITTGTWNATTIGVNYGGTGLTSYTIGDIITASATTTLASITAVAVGNVLLSGGVATKPAWGKVALTSHISGILPIANGGTNASTEIATTNGLVYFDGTRLINSATYTTATILTTGRSKYRLAMTLDTGLIWYISDAVGLESGTDQIYVNGLLQKEGAGEDYVISYNATTDRIIATFVAGHPVVSTDKVLISYVQD